MRLCSVTFLILLPASLLLPALPAAGQVLEKDPLERKVTLAKPYPRSTSKSSTHKIAVQYAVFEIAKQALLGYNFGQSSNNLGQLASHLIEPDINNETLRAALNKILTPLGIGYQLERGEIILVRKTNRPPPQRGSAVDRRVTLMPPYKVRTDEASRKRICLHLAVQLLLQQAGIEYDRQTSDKNTRPTSRRWIQPRIDNLPLRRALNEILRPLDLNFRIERNRLVLVLQPSQNIEGPLSVRVSLIAPYPTDYPGAYPNRITIHHAVIELARQAGLSYDLKTSRKNTQEAGTKIIHPDIRNQRLQNALLGILRPLGLDFQIKDLSLALTVYQPDQTTALKTKVSLLPPYPAGIRRGPQGSVQLLDAVRELAKQADLEVRRPDTPEGIFRAVFGWVRPNIRERPLDEALARLLEPRGLQYELRKATLILKETSRTKDTRVSERLKRKVALTKPYPRPFQKAPTHRIQLLHAVQELLRQVGLQLDLRTSVANMGNLASKYISPRIEGASCSDALANILEPYKLTYRIIDNKIVIERK